MIFLSLLSTAFSSVFYGMIVTGVVMALLYVLLRSLSKGIVQSIPFYVTGVVLALLLTIQFTLMIGAMQAKDTADAAKIYTTQLLEDASGIVGAQDSQMVLDAITEQFPIIGAFVGFADFSGTTVSDLAESMYSSIVDFLNTYIWHRVWWILGIVVVACLIVSCFSKNEIEKTRTMMQNNRTRVVAQNKKYKNF